MSVKGNKEKCLFENRQTRRERSSANSFILLSSATSCIDDVWIIWMWETFNAIHSFAFIHRRAKVCTHIRSRIEARRRTNCGILFQRRFAFVCFCSCLVFVILTSSENYAMKIYFYFYLGYFPFTMIIRRICLFFPLLLPPRQEGISGRKSSSNYSCAWNNWN